MSKDADDHIIHEGAKFTIEFAVLDDGTMPGREYFDSLPREDQRRIKAYMEALAENGKISNREKFRAERAPFFAFKHKGQSQRKIRLPCYREGSRWIVTHGFDKPAQAQWEEREFTRATEIRNEQLSRERRQKEKKREANG